MRAQDALGADTGAGAINDAGCDFVADTSGTASYVSPTVIAFPAGYYFLDMTAHFPGNITRKFPEKGFALLLVSPE